jgi:hypothetical protein
VDQTGIAHRPLNIEELPPEFQGMVGFLKPFMASNMGKMGKGFSFFVFSSKTSSGQVLGKGSVPGRFSLKLDDCELTWRLPLGSLLPEQQCARCGEKLSGAFAYCPYDATRLAR